MKASPSPGGHELVEGLVRLHREELLAFVRRRAGHLVEPEDVVQQASERAFASAQRLRDPSRGRAWLFRIVRNVLTDELRKLDVPVPEPLDEERQAAPPAEEQGGACRCALELAQTLKPEYREILERSVLEDASVTAVAAELGVTPNNAMVRLHRARGALRALVEQRCGTPSLRACLSCVCDEKGCCAAR